MLDTITITVPREAAEALVKHWQEGTNNLQVVKDVRDLFDGGDGHLTVLEAALQAREV